MREAEPAQHWAVEERAIDWPDSRMILPYLHWVYQRVLAIALLRMSIRDEVDGFMVHVDPNVPGGEQTIDAIYDRVGASLRMIRELAPLRWRRIQRDVRRIAVFQPPTGGYGEFSPVMRAILLQPAYVLDRPEASVALLIVHEATHARLRNRGLRYLPDVRARHERICIRQEIELARKFPDEPQRAYYLERLAVKLDFWNGS